MAMDAKDLRIETGLGSRGDDGNTKYSQSGTTLQTNGNKPYHDIGSNSLAKVDVPTARPCAIIGPDRVLPPQATSDTYLKKVPVEPWPCTDSVYQHPPQYPHKSTEYQPSRNISPRQTFQENMQRIMVPPSYASMKNSEDCFRNPKMMPLDSKFCDVPYTVSPINSDPKTVKSSEGVLPNNNCNQPVLPHGWVGNNVNARPLRPYGAPELYQYSEYPNYPGPRPMSMIRPHRNVHEDVPQSYQDRFYHEANVRFKPYPTAKDRPAHHPHARYEYIPNYPTVFHPHAPYPPHKYDLPKSISTNPYSVYPSIPIKYLDRRMPAPAIEKFSRTSSQQVNFNPPFCNQNLSAPYGSVPGNCLQNRPYPYAPDPFSKHMIQNKLHYDGNNSQKYYTNSENMFINNVNVPPTLKNDILYSSYPPIHSLPPHHMYRKENPIKGYEQAIHYRNVEYSTNMNSLGRHPVQFLPQTLSASSDSNKSNDTTFMVGNLQDDFGYAGQSSMTSLRSMEAGVNRPINDIYRRHEGLTHINKSVQKIDSNTNTSKDKKDLNVRQFLQMWNEGDDESNENKTTARQKDSSNSFSHYESSNNQEQLYVLDLVTVPSEELAKYDHIQKISKLPENIKGYNSIELLNQYEKLVESPNLNNFPSTPSQPKQKDLNASIRNGLSRHGMTSTINARPISPLDVEAKISQSVIHKEVGCNFEIRPCSPPMMNVELATPVHNVLGERLIEKVVNSVKSQSPLHHIIDETSNSSRNLPKVTSCKMAKNLYPSTNINDSLKTNYCVQDLEGNSGVCLASLPRLDNDIELNFPEINQQFINDNKMTSIQDLPILDTDGSGITIKGNVKNQSIVPENLQSGSESDKEISKLSKYRKHKRNSSTNDNIVTANVSLHRTDSVIIKNPENGKCQDDYISNTTLVNDTTSSEKNPKSINTNVRNDKTKSSCKKNIETVYNNINESTTMDTAIDFSINKCGGEQGNNNIILNNIGEDLQNNVEIDRNIYLNSETNTQNFSKVSTKRIYKQLEDMSTSDNFSSLEPKSPVMANFTVSGLLDKNMEMHSIEGIHETVITRSNSKDVVSDILLSNSLPSEKNDSQHRLLSSSHDAENALQNIPTCSSNILDINALNDNLQNQVLKYCLTENSEVITPVSKLENNLTLGNEKDRVSKTGNNEKDKPITDQNGQINLAMEDVTRMDMHSDIRGQIQNFEDMSIQDSKYEISQIEDVIRNNTHSDSHSGTKNFEEVSMEQSKYEISPIADVPRKDTHPDSHTVTKNFQEVAMQASKYEISEIEDVTQNNTRSDSHTGTNYFEDISMQESKYEISPIEDVTRRNTRPNSHTGTKNFQEVPMQASKYEISEIEDVTQNNTRSDLHTGTNYFEDISMQESKYEISPIEDVSRRDTRPHSPTQTKKFAMQESKYEISPIVDVTRIDTHPESQTRTKNFEKVPMQYSKYEISQTDDVTRSNTHSDSNTRTKNFEEISMEQSKYEISQIEDVIRSDMHPDSHTQTKNVEEISMLESKYEISPIEDVTRSDMHPDSHRETENFEDISMQEFDVISEPKTIILKPESTLKKDSDQNFRTNQDIDSPNKDDNLEKLTTNEINIYILDSSKSDMNNDLIAVPVNDIRSTNILCADIDNFQDNELVSKINSKNTDMGIKIENETLLNLLNNDLVIENVIDAPNDDKKNYQLKPDNYFKKELFSPRFQSLWMFKEGSYIKSKSYGKEKIDKMNNYLYKDRLHQENGDLKTSIKTVLVEKTLSQESEYNASDPSSYNIEDSKCEIEMENSRNTEENKTIDRFEYINHNVNNITIVNNKDDQSEITDTIKETIVGENLNKTGDEESKENDEVWGKDIEMNMKCRNDSKENMVVTEQLMWTQLPNRRNKSLKRSLSESALNEYMSSDDGNFYGSNLMRGKKRQKTNDSEILLEPQVVTENFANFIQSNRRNSISTIYNDENVSFCIVIDNDCVLTEGNNQKICYTELSEDCLTTICSEEGAMNAELNEVISFDDIDQTNSEGVAKNSELTEYTSYENGDSTTANAGIVDSVLNGEKNSYEELEQRAYKNELVPQDKEDFEVIDEAWVDDVACMETIFSDDVAEDIVISAPLSPKDSESSDEESDITSYMYSVTENEHTNKVKYIYGNQMCDDDADLVEKLYRTPQMDVNKTLTDRESQLVQGYSRYYDNESLEKILSESNTQETYSFPENSNVSDKSAISPDITSVTGNDVHGNKENLKELFPKQKSVNEIELSSSGHIKSSEEKKSNEYDNCLVHSCENSYDKSYKKEEKMHYAVSSSPEVSSTTPEERGPGILLKIRSYKGSKISEINEINKNDGLPTYRPLITKAAQKYIPPLKETIRDLKVKIRLPKQSLYKLQQLKNSKEEPKNDKSRSKHYNKSLPQEIPKKAKHKPKFEDVLMSIDEINFKKHKVKNKKTKQSVPKVIIKKNENGAHYASTQTKETFNPDLTGRKWQPWVFLEKSNFVDKMALKKKFKAIYNHRKKTYVLAESFRKYKSVSNAKFVISHPNSNDNTTTGKLKYTFRLKHS